MPNFNCMRLVGITIPDEVTSILASSFCMLMLIFRKGVTLNNLLLQAGCPKPSSNLNNPLQPTISADAQQKVCLLFCLIWYVNFLFIFV